MRRSSAGFSTVLGPIALVGLGGMALLGAAVYNGGAIRVHVREGGPQGTNIHVIVPAILVRPALGLVPDDKLRDAVHQVKPWIPAIMAASEELERCPDGPLVQVINSEEKVEISKHGPSLQIDVEDREDSVHVSFPIKTVMAAMSRLKAAEEAN